MTANKTLLSLSLVPFYIIVGNSNFLVIDEYGVHNTVSIDLETHASHMTTLLTNDLINIGCRSVNGNMNTGDDNPIEGVAARASTDKRTREYTVDKIV